jgi:S-(hydroxymethyl)glutathione dehydrogenase / alcohol dehydrogenase
LSLIYLEIGCAVLTGLGCAFRAAQVTEGSTVAVFGIGAIGLNAVQGSRVAGASTIIAVDINPNKEAIARQFGATHFINPAKLGDVTLAEAVKTALGGSDQFLDFAFEATGNTTVLSAAANLVHPLRGVCIAVGIPHATSELKMPATTFMIGRTVKGVYFGNAKPISFGKQILDWYSQKKIQIEPLITHRIKLEEINKGLELLEKGEAVRAVVIYD